MGRGHNLPCIITIASGEVRPMGRLGKTGRHEGVNDGQQEDAGGHGVERLGLDARPQQVEESTPGRVGVGRERQRKRVSVHE